MESSDLAYWVGVVQTDGSLKKVFLKRTNRQIILVALTVGSLSVPMLQQFAEISQKIFGMKGSTWVNRKRGCVEYKFGAKSLIPVFQRLGIDFTDPPKPPSWITNDQEYFGAYLAGVIDGDGDVTIRRPQYPQCAVRVTSGSPQNELRGILKEKLGIGVSLRCQVQQSVIERRFIVGTSYKLEFYISPKNALFFRNYVVPYMTIHHKKIKIKDYLQNRITPETFK